MDYSLAEYDDPWVTNLINPRHIEIAGNCSIIIFGLGDTPQTDQRMAKQTTFDNLKPKSVISFNWTWRKRFLVAQYGSDAEADKAFQLYNRSRKDGCWAIRAFPCVLRKIRIMSIWEDNGSTYGKSMKGGDQSSVTVNGGKAINERTNIDLAIFDTYWLRHPFPLYNRAPPTVYRHVVVPGDRSVLLRDIAPDHFNLEKLWDLGTRNDTSPLFEIHMFTTHSSRFAILQYGSPTYACTMQTEFYRKIKSLLRSRQQPYNPHLCYDYEYRCQTYVNWRGNGVVRSECNVNDRVDVLVQGSVTKERQRLKRTKSFDSK